MAEILDRPNTFTPETAREAGLRSAEVARHKAQELENLRVILATKPIQAQQPEPEQTNVQREVQRQIELTNEQLACVRKELERMNSDDFGFCEECKRHGADGKELAALLREMRGLMEHLCRLHAIPAAPTSKVNPKPAQARHATVQPIGPAPQQAVVPPTEPQS